MGPEDVVNEVKNVKDTVVNGYNTAETKVDSFFARNKYTVLILSGVALVIVALVLKALF